MNRPGPVARYSLVDPATVDPFTDLAVTPLRQPDAAPTWARAWLTSTHAASTVRVPITADQATAFLTPPRPGIPARGFAAGDVLRLGHLPSLIPGAFTGLVLADGEGWPRGAADLWTTLRLWVPDLRGYLVAPGTEPRSLTTPRLWADARAGAWHFGFYDPDAARMHPILTAAWHDVDAFTAHVDLLRDTDAFNVQAALAEPHLVAGLTNLQTLCDLLR